MTVRRLLSCAAALACATLPLFIPGIPTDAAPTPTTVNTSYAQMPSHDHTRHRSECILLIPVSPRSRTRRFRIRVGSGSSNSSVPKPVIAIIVGCRAAFAAYTVYKKIQAIKAANTLASNGAAKGTQYGTGLPTPGAIPQQQYGNTVPIPNNGQGNTPQGWQGNTPQGGTPYGPTQLGTEGTTGARAC